MQETITGGTDGKERVGPGLHKLLRGLRRDEGRLTNRERRNGAANGSCFVKDHYRIIPGLTGSDRIDCERRAVCAGNVAAIEPPTIRERARGVRGHRESRVL